MNEITVRDKYATAVVRFEGKPKEVVANEIIAAGIKQGIRCVDDYGCEYFKDGDRCFIGMLLPEDLAKKAHGGIRACINKAQIMGYSELADMLKNDFSFWGIIQLIHDHPPSCSEDVGHIYGLDTALLDKWFSLVGGITNE